MNPIDETLDFSRPAQESSICRVTPIAPPPATLHGCPPNDDLGRSSTLTQEDSDSGLSTWDTIARHTMPRLGSPGRPGSPWMPMTARTVPARFLLEFRPTRITVGVPWPGMYAPDVSMTSVKFTQVAK